MRVKIKTTSEDSSKIKRADGFWSMIATRRRESIRKSLLRPLYQDALKTLFLCVVLFLDSLVPLQFYVSFGSPLNIVGTLVALGVFLYVEARIYNALWGKNGRWALKHYEKPVESPKDAVIKH
jgi:hypothetical protein